MSETRTRYDWAPGKRGRVLAPEGSKSVHQQVVTGVLRWDTLRILFDEDRLCGEALEDARRRYEAPMSSLFS